MKHAVPLILGFGVAAAIGCGGSGDTSTGDQSVDFQQPSLADQLGNLSDRLPFNDQAPPSDPQEPPPDDQQIATETDVDACVLLCSRPDVARCDTDCVAGCAEFRSDFGALCAREVDAWLLCIVERADFVCEQDVDQLDVCRNEILALGQCRQNEPDVSRPDQPPTAGTAPAEPAPAPGADADGGAAL